MKAAGITEIKQELSELPPKKVIELCLRLARFKKENKELLSFLLFDAHNEAAYVQTIKNEMDEAFNELNTSSVYFTKKGLRKLLRQLSKYSKHISEKASEVELRLHFCNSMKTAQIPYQKHQVLKNIYQQQVKKLYSLIDDLHEDLKFDYSKQLEAL